MSNQKTNAEIKSESKALASRREELQSDKPTCDPRAACPHRSSNSSSSRKWLAGLLVGAVAIAFLVSSVVPDSSNFAQLWPAIQAAFWAVIIYYFAERKAK